MESNEELLRSFHQTWRNFPGVARLIRKDHVVLASNKAALAAGLEPGQVCAKMGNPEAHRRCLKNDMLKTGEAQMDMPAPNKLRGWVPVLDNPDVFVHFSMVLPE